MYTKATPILLIMALVEVRCYNFDAISEEEASTRQSLSQCVIEASKQFFTSDFEIITISQSVVETGKDLVSSIVLTQLLFPVLENEYRWTFFVKNVSNLSVFNTNKYLWKTYSYILQIRKDGEIADNIRKLKLFLSWNPHGKFLVVSATLFPNPHKVALNVVKTLWEFNVINVAVVLADENNATNFKVYSWEPYSNNSCADNFSTISVIDDCSFGSINGNRSWFEEKISKNVFNCPVKVNYKVWPPFVNEARNSSEMSDTKRNIGIDVNLLNMIADTLHIRLIYNHTAYNTWGHVNADGTATKDLKHLIDNDIDILVGAYVRTPHINTYLDASRPYIQDSLQWCVPHESVIEGVETISGIFSPCEWIFIWFIFLTMSVFTWFISCFSRIESQAYKKLTSSLQLNFSILVGVAVKILPKIWKIRSIMFLYLVFSFVLNLEYSSYLTSSLSSHHYTEKYSRIGHIYKYNLDTYFVPNTIYFFNNMKKTNLRNIPISLVLNKWKNCTDDAACLKELALNKKSATCFPRLHKNYLLNNVESLKEVKKNIHCFKGSVIGIPINMVMRKGFPLYKSFDEVMKRIISSGFIVKWERDNHVGDEVDKDVKKEEKIRYKNLAPVFYMYLVGMGVSLFLFAVENVVYRRNIIIAKMQ